MVCRVHVLLTLILIIVDHCLLEIHWDLVCTIAYLDGNSRQGKYHKINVGHLKFQRTLSRQNNIILEFLYYFNHFN